MGNDLTCQNYVPGVNKGAYATASNLEARNITSKFFTFLNYDVKILREFDDFGNRKDPVITEKELQDVDRRDRKVGKHFLEPSLSAYDFQSVFGKNPPESAKKDRVSMFDFTTRILGGKVDLKNKKLSISRDDMYTRLSTCPEALATLKKFMGEK